MPDLQRIYIKTDSNSQHKFTKKVWLVKIVMVYYGKGEINMNIAATDKSNY